MILSTCIIIGHDGELPSLKRCIDSFYEQTDEIIVTANGKHTDEIKKYCESDPKIKYFFLPWNKNFSEQRNFCASKVRKDADFYFWVDVDDVIEGAEHLRPIAEKAKKQGLGAVFFTYWYGCLFNGEPSRETLEKVELVQTRERLLKPGLTVWKNRLHETPVPVDSVEFTYTTVKYDKDSPIAWLHLGVYRGMSEEEQRVKTARNRELLELQLEDEKRTSGADPRTLIYLMKIYAEEDDPKLWEKTLEMGDEYMLKSGWDAERASCCCIMGKVLGKLGREREAKELLFDAIKEYPYDPLLYLYLSRSCGNLKQYREMKHWLEAGLALDPAEAMSNVTNMLELKLLSTELTLHYAYNAEKNPRKAYKAMQMLYNELPTQSHKESLDLLKNLSDLDNASEAAHKLMLYYQEQENHEGVVRVVESMPETMRTLPFAWELYNKHKVPRIWKENEICYYANFGKPHLERWDGNNLKQGLGGSETAVIRLAEEWTKKGWKVVVYGDPAKRTEINGVVYLPYFEFNPRDYFNIFIQWRSSFLAHRIKAKKFLVDLHDVVSAVQFKDKETAVDKYMVKSKYHASLLEGFELERLQVVSNGI